MALPAPLFVDPATLKAAVKAKPNVHPVAAAAAAAHAAAAAARSAAAGGSAGALPPSNAPRVSEDSSNVKGKKGPRGGGRKRRNASDEGTDGDRVMEDADEQQSFDDMRSLAAAAKGSSKRRQLTGKAAAAAALSHGQLSLDPLAMTGMVEQDSAWLPPASGAAHTMAATSASTSASPAAPAGQLPPPMFSWPGMNTNMAAAVSAAASGGEVYQGFMQGFSQGFSAGAFSAPMDYQGFSGADGAGLQMQASGRMSGEMGGYGGGYWEGLAPAASEGMGGCVSAPMSAAPSGFDIQMHLDDPVMMELYMKELPIAQALGAAPGVGSPEEPPAAVMGHRDSITGAAVAAAGAIASSDAGAGTAAAGGEDQMRQVEDVDDQEMEEWLLSLHDDQHQDVTADQSHTARNMCSGPMRVPVVETKRSGERAEEGDAVAPGSPCGLSKKQQQQQGGSTEQVVAGTAARQLFSCNTAQPAGAASPEPQSVDSAPSSGTVLGVGNAGGTLQEPVASNSSTNSKAPESAAAAGGATSNATPLTTAGGAGVAAAAGHGLNLRSAGSSSMMDMMSLAQPGAGLAPLKTFSAVASAAGEVGASGSLHLTSSRSMDFATGVYAPAGGAAAAHAGPAGLSPFYQAQLYQQYLQSAMQGSMGMSRAVSAAAPLPPLATGAPLISRVASAPAISKFQLPSLSPERPAAAAGAANSNPMMPFMGLGGRGHLGAAASGSLGGQGEKGLSSAAVAAMTAAAGAAPGGMTPALLALLRQPALMAANPLATAVMAATLGGPLGAAVAMNSAAAVAAAGGGSGGPAAAGSMRGGGGRPSAGASTGRPPVPAGAQAVRSGTSAVELNGATAAAAAGGLKGQHAGSENPMAAVLESIGKDDPDCACVYCRLKRQRGASNPPPLPPPPLILAELTQQLSRSGSSSARSFYTVPSASPAATALGGAGGRLAGLPTPLWNASSLPQLSGQHSWQQGLALNAVSAAGGLTAAGMNLPAYLGGSSAWGSSNSNTMRAVVPGSGMLQLQPVLGLQLDKVPSPGTQATASVAAAAGANKAMFALGADASLSAPMSLPYDQERPMFMQLDFAEAAGGPKGDLLVGRMPQSYEAMLAGLVAGHEGVHAGVGSPCSDISSGSLLAPQSFPAASAAAVAMAL